MGVVSHVLITCGVFFWRDNMIILVTIETETTTTNIVVNTIQSKGHHTPGNLVAATNVCFAVALQIWKATSKQLTSNIVASYLIHVHRKNGIKLK